MNTLIKRLEELKKECKDIEKDIDKKIYKTEIDLTLTVREINEIIYYIETFFVYRNEYYGFNNILNKLKKLINN